MKRKKCVGCPAFFAPNGWWQPECDLGFKIEMIEVKKTSLLDVPVWSPVNNKCTKPKSLKEYVNMKLR